MVLKVLKNLYLLQKNAVTDSIKFQALYADRLMADKSILFSYT